MHSPIPSKGPSKKKIRRVRRKGKTSIKRRANVCADTISEVYSSPFAGGGVTPELNKYSLERKRKRNPNNPRKTTRPCLYNKV